MSLKPIVTAIFISFLVLFSLHGLASPTLTQKKEAQLNSDLEKIWPFIQTVKVEYELVLAQLETIECDSTRKEFLLTYEKYVKDAYFDKVVRLNVRQGRLLLLLIHRELGKTPYELLVKFLNKERADFWQKMALILDTDLKGKYSPFLYPDFELIVLRLAREKKHDYLLPN
jgi:hypothetical protein